MIYWKKKKNYDLSFDSTGSIHPPHCFFRSYSSQGNVKQRYRKCHMNFSLFNFFLSMSGTTFFPQIHNLIVRSANTINTSHSIIVNQSKKSSIALSARRKLFSIFLFPFVFLYVQVTNDHSTIKIGHSLILAWTISLPVRNEFAVRNSRILKNTVYKNWVLFTNKIKKKCIVFKKMIFRD